jgi:2,3,4,5-tetrahydropyridine-2-carboxylate N-succinyltransferase
MADLEAQIDALWEHRDDMTAVMSETEAAVCVRAAIDLLDRGEVRVAERIGDDVVVHQWLKQAILLLFRLTHMETTELGPFEYRDKIPLKRHFQRSGVRVVPGASVMLVGVFHCSPAFAHSFSAKALLATVQS